VINRYKLKSGGDQVSELTAGRLAVYLRCLNLLDADGIKTVSSKILAERFHLNAAQIRKDLAYFGEFGVRGVGYYIKELKQDLHKILGLDRAVHVAIIGAGNLGMALADYPGFRQEGFVVAGLFDAARSKVGHRSKGGVPIFDVADFKKMARKQAVSIAVLAVPAAAGQSVVNMVVGCGVRAILNFSPGSLKAPQGVKLTNLDVTVSMASLSFFLTQGRPDV